MSSDMVRILLLGDVVGRPGRTAVAHRVPELRTSLNLDLVIVNGENSAGGAGIDAKTAGELRDGGVDLITLGDHAWQRRGVGEFLSRAEDYCVRPANYPGDAPGMGWLTHPLPNGGTLGLFNVLGRVFTGALVDCPFDVSDKLLSGPLRECDIVICDIHAEATSEKIALGWYLDGRVSAVVGTHTHVPTADERVLPAGTAYITDLGMCGSSAGVLGMDREVALFRFRTGRPASYKVAKGETELNGVVVAVDASTGKATAIERICVARNDADLSAEDQDD